MKKLMLISVVAFMAAIIFTSCQKKDNVIVPEKQYVSAIAGTFNVQDGNLLFKATAPVASTRTWTMLSNNADFYPPGVFTLVDGREFITGSAAQIFWSNPANNPVAFSASQAVYSNLTPDEDLRLITETKDSNGDVAYLGMLDFNPNAQSFPLTIHGFRLGDVLTINTDAVTSLPGGNNLTITVDFDVALIDLAATKAVSTLTGNPGIPNGTEFAWADVVYGAPAPYGPVTVGSGNFDVYDALDGKVMGNIVITLTEANNGGSIIVLAPVTALGAGHGLKLTLVTGKIGWYDSGTINFSDTDITVDAQDVIVN